MNFKQSAIFQTEGYPLALIRNSLGDYLIYDGEGDLYSFSSSGDFLVSRNLSKAGFSDAVEFDEFVVLVSLDGKCFISNSLDTFKYFDSNISHPCFWGNHLFYIRNNRLIKWSFSENRVHLLDKFTDVQNVWNCGEVLLVMTRSSWEVLTLDGSIELLTRDVLPFKSCSFLPKNNTFHFVLPQGQLGLIDMSGRDIEPFVNQAVGMKLKIIGISDHDKLAISFSNQLIFLKADGLKIDEYSTTTVEDLPTEPLKCVPHPTLSLFLVQEDEQTAAIWKADESRCLWRSSFNSSICYLKFCNEFFFIGCSDGLIYTFYF